jgi:spermidine synthase
MRDRSFVVVASCFFLSGFAALIYETAWIREFSFVFGTSELAVATVLAAYMAGLAGGAAVGGRLAVRVRRPLVTYALLEAGVGVAALLVPIAIAGATRLLVAFFGHQRGFGETDPLAISLFYLVATFVIVMVPTAFMGATLPLLSRHVVKTDAEIGPRIGALYSINTLGAVAGTTSAAFLLLPWLGIRSTVFVAVGVNAVVFGVAAALVRLSPAPPAAPIEASEAPSTVARGWHAILPLILLSGALSFVYEVLWARLLNQLLGGSIYAFTTMLASFLTGIALGSAFASRLARSSDRALRLFAWAEVGIAVLTALSFGLIDSSRVVIHVLGSERHLLIDVLLSMMVLLPAALCIGATFPLAVRVLARDALDAGPASARVYSWNTIGAIAGSIGAAFVLLPMLGFRGTVLLGITINLAIAAVAFAMDARRGLVALPAVLVALLVLLLPGEPWEVLRSSPLSLDAAPKSGEMGFYAVGRGATVMLTEETPTTWRISTNGLPEALISTLDEPPGRSKTAILLGAIGPILRPEARSMLMVGLGGGVSLERVPRNIERIDVIELEEEVLAANRWLAPRRAIDPLADPRVDVHINDARSALFLSDQKFDVIAAQASHPWTGGAAHLYSGEFFGLVADHLNDDGVFVQWVGRDFIDVDLFRSIVRTLLDHFRYVQVYREILFVASNSPLPDAVDFEALRAIDPDLSSRLGLYTAEDLASSMLMDSVASARFAEGAEPIHDDRNWLQMRSPKIVRSPPAERKWILQRILNAYQKNDPLSRLIAMGELDGIDLVRRLENGQGGRARWLAGQLDDSVDRARLAALGLAGRDMRRPALERYLLAHPDDREVRARWLHLMVAGGGSDPDARGWLAGLAPDASEAAVIEATRADREGSWEALAAIDDRLAAIAPEAPLHVDATLYRVGWRIRSGDAGRAQEAIELIDDLLRTGASNALLELRADAASVRHDLVGELASLSRLNASGRSKPARAFRKRIRERLNRLALEGELAEWRDELVAQRFGDRK